MADGGTSGRIRIKIGDAEFDAEGPASLINSQFERFIAAFEGRLALQPAVQPKAPIPATPAAAPDPPLAERVDASANGDLSPLPPAILERLYQLDGEGLSLRILPNTGERDADVILLLLYGYKVLKNESDVGAGDLKKAARQSGITVERIDRVIGPHRARIVDGGRGKGKRYGLNNVGMTAATAVARATAE